MTKSVIHENMFLTLITCLIFDVAICQLPNTPTYRSLVFKNIGIKLCQLKCAENGFCRSIEYTISTLTCHLSEMDHDTTTNEAQHFVGSKDLADVRAGSCDLKTCPNMRCLETRTGKTECVKEKWNHIELNTTLLDACMVGDLALVKFILSDGRADINSIGKDNMTPVMHAAKEGHEEVFDLLVREGANVSLVDDKDRNILHLACIGGNVEIVKYALTKNIVGINSRGTDGWTPAMIAALYKRKDVFDLLVGAGADLLLLNELKETILHVACEGGNVEIVKYLMKHDIVDIDSRDLNDETPVMASVGHEDVFHVLVKAGADLSLVNSDNETILHLACQGGIIKIIKYLMKHDIVDIGSRDVVGWTPVMHAVNDGREDVFNFLVEKGADLSQVSYDEENILHLACGGRNVEIIKYLLRHAVVDIDSRDINGWTPVMYAVSYGHKNMLDILVKAGADMSVVSYDKENILHLACGGGNVEIIKYLLRHAFVDIDSRDINGWTPGMHAASNGHKDVFDVLVEAGADMSVVSNDKENILHLACGGGNVEIIKYLLRHAVVDIESRDINGWTPGMYAASNGHKDVFDVLVEAGADMSVVSNDKENILHLACGGGNVEIIKYLLRHAFVDIDSQDINGWTPGMHAASYGHKDVFDVLVEAGADLSQVGNKKETILHVSCEKGNVEIIKYLLTHKIVDIDSRDEKGLTPIMHTTIDKRKDVFDLLVKGGADLSILDKNNNNILHLACNHDSVEIIKQLLTDKLVDINSRDEDDCTSAMIAARDGHEAVFNLLVENGADLTIINDVGDNILNMACEGGNVHIVEYVSTRHIVEGPYREDDPC